jgi:Rrf2 family nitric oxide-sensitive transcriptional repressor
MRLAEYTDYTLRVLMYCAAHVRSVGHDQRSWPNITGCRRNHLMKIVTDLAARACWRPRAGAAAACAC